jgi:D-beta-D-heptose 7-phosphate kinase/D-beta-D-heptose 1-phosphate adenosyltransferase
MNIIVIGDTILDINNISDTYRMAPEANIPIYKVLDTKYILGGATNVCYNLQNLNTNVELISVIGNDNFGSKITDILLSKRINHTLFIEDNRKTTQKNRIIMNDTINVRFDIEDDYDITNETSDKIISYVKSKQSINAIVISDYDKGVITEYLCTNLITYANSLGIPTFVDPKIKNHRKYTNCFCIKPNLNEIKILTNHEDNHYANNNNTIDKMLGCLKEKLTCNNILLTLGKDGMILNNTVNFIKHNHAVTVKDVTGSGDLVLAVLVYMYLIEKDLLLASKVSNYIAGKGVTVIGNYVTSMDDINEYKENVLLYESKIIFDYEVEKIKTLSRKNNIVFTNGCFDILHSAHIKLLQFSKKQGDILVVGLNSDTSIKRIKGLKRPINDIDERSVILSLFDFIDFIIIFEDDTPYNVIKNLSPHTLVKGSDYKKEEVVGNELVEKVVLFNLINNKSSTNIINKIKNI